MYININININNLMLRKSIRFFYTIKIEIITISKFNNIIIIILIVISIIKNRNNE
jgi:hypothetical protein